MRPLCHALKPLRVYRKLSPYAVVKKEWGHIKGYKGSTMMQASTVTAAIGEKVHLGTKRR